MVIIADRCGDMSINKEREFDDMAKWYACCFTISIILIAFIVWWIKNITENLRFSHQKNIDKIVTEDNNEKKKNPQGYTSGEKQ